MNLRFIFRNPTIRNRNEITYPTSVKSSMAYPPQALYFLFLTALKNIHVAMAMLIFLCLARNKNYFGLTETPHLT